MNSRPLERDGEGLTLGDYSATNKKQAYDQSFRSAIGLSLFYTNFILTRPSRPRPRSGERPFDRVCPLPHH